ncbi:MAG: hypothetical protein AAGI17_06140, partial [Planctomycetota bacterium]
LTKSNNLLSRITRGRYELRLKTSDGSSSFCAHDTTENRTKPLDVLSGGERVQVLLAVRVGFLQADNAGVACPLILDETLGTSDDDRAAALIDALTEIARDSRQVIYFTAQLDEVAKWRGHLENDPASRIIGLGNVRKLAAHSASAELPEPIPPREIPEPGDLSHAAYGKLLQVPRINPREPAGRAHIWHLFEEPDLLHQLLSRRISTLGPLTQEVVKRKLIVPGLTDEHRDRIRARVEATSAAVEAWGVGRGKPVYRTDLDISGAVSDNFIDDVADLARQVDHDADRLLDALEDKRVKRWRSSSTEELRSFFNNNGYRSEELPLSADDAFRRVLNAVEPSLHAYVMDGRWLDRLIALLGFEESPTASR